MIYTRRVSLEFRAATVGDLRGIINLIQTAFRAKPDAPFLDEQLLQWKYFEPGPGWNGSRSYVLAQNGSILAHGCAWPVKLVHEGRSHSGLCLLDWVASKSSLGAGLQLVREMASLTDILISIGGSQATRQLMPRMGFRIVDEQSLYVRVLRPWRQFRTRPGAVTFKEFARLVRNTGYSLPRRASANGWSLHRVATVDPQLFVDSLPASGPASSHDARLVEYMTRCPAVSIASYELLKDGRPGGYVVLSLVNGQSRIVELRMRSRTQEDWTAAISAVIDAALEVRNACELLAWTSEPLLTHALGANGFRPRDRRSIFVLDSRNLFPAAGSCWDLTMLDDDSAFLNFPDHPYAT